VSELKVVETIRPATRPRNNVVYGRLLEGVDGLFAQAADVAVAPELALLVGHLPALGEIADFEGGLALGELEDLVDRCDPARALAALQVRSPGRRIHVHIVAPADDKVKVGVALNLKASAPASIFKSNYVDHSLLQKWPRAAYETRIGGRARPG
jgi:hypothetical protein